MMSQNKTHQITTTTARSMSNPAFNAEKQSEVKGHMNYCEDYKQIVDRGARTYSWRKSVQEKICRSAP